MIPFAYDFNNFIIIRQLQSKVEHYMGSDSRKLPIFLISTWNKRVVQLLHGIKKKQQHQINLINVKL